MTVLRIDAYVLFAENAKHTTRFYQHLGIAFEAEQHDGGDVHFACTLAGAHLAIYSGTSSAAPSLGRRQAGNQFIGLRVDDVNATLLTLQAAELLTIEVPLESVPWGKRAVIVDPDGRFVELNEAVLE